MTNLSSGFDKDRGVGLRDLALRAASALGGAVLFIVSLILLLVLLTYDPTDPSWNVATPKASGNFGGPSGAVLADLLIQTIGLAGYLIPIVLAVWALRLLLNLPVRQVWMRLLALPVLLLLTAISLGILPGNPGGVIGRNFWPMAGLNERGLGDFVFLPAMLGAGLAALLLLFIFGLTRGEWQQVGRRTLTAAKASRVGTVAMAKAGQRVGFRTWLWGRKVAEPALRRQAEDLMRRTGPRQPPVRPRNPAASGDQARVEPRIVPSEAASPETMSGHQTTAPAAPSDHTGSPPIRRELSPDLVAPKPATPAAGKRVETNRQQSLTLDPQTYELPPLSLVAAPPLDQGHGGRGHGGPSQEALQQNALLLLNVLEDFGVRGEIVKVRPGPVVTLYELEPAPGTKSSRVIGLADDIARSMSAISVRVAVVPGRNVIGIELPNARAETVYLYELLASEAYERSQAKLTLILGKDIGGAPIVADLAKMPHLLIAGTTGSGKSVGINTMILSILYRMPPDQCKFIMIDPKMLELSIYDGIPHLLAPVVTDPKKAVVALKWTVREMENRYRLMSKLGVRNIEGYNARLADAVTRGESLSRRVQTGFNAETGEPEFEEQVLDSTPLPFIVVVVDEMADLMLVAGKDIEAAIQRLAQMARAAGIHIITATQRPSVDVITGTIKANFPTRISFQVTSKIDSRTILGESGAEQLLGRGDMLYMAGGGRITRVHGPFVADSEVEGIVNFLKSQGSPAYLDDITEDDEQSAEPGGETQGGDQESDELYDRAVALVTRERKASTSFVQRHLQIGYNRAARIMDRMEQENVVSGANHVGKREVLAPPPPRV